jgi:nitrogen fixation protein NifU and related proteins
MDHFMAPMNGGFMEHPDLTGHAGAPGRGAFMVLFLKVQEGRIAAAKYHTVGCGPTIACGSMLTKLIVGQTVADCRELTAERLIEALDGVPPDKLHRPAITIAALHDALGRAESRIDGGKMESLTTEGSEGHGNRKRGGERPEGTEGTARRPWTAWVEQTGGFKPIE